MPAPSLEIGQIVNVRARQYLVESVTPPIHPEGDTLVSLACLNDDAQGQVLEVFWEREIDAQILGNSTWEQVAQRGFDRPQYFSAYLHTLRWNCVTSTDPKLFQAPYRAGIEVKAYQLEPLRKALLMPRVSLFIADDVGLGKTIEAGLILREMIMRQKIRRVVIACPPSVVRQWQEEMESRFGLLFQVVDREFFATKRRERGYGINPWTTHNRFIISQSLVRDETYAAPLRDWLEEFAPGSMLILDEAHNVAPASGSRYAIDSQLTKTMRELAPRFEHKLFLSATPHNGHSNSFTALLEILDPQRFCRGVFDPEKNKKALETVMVRRLKQDLRATGDTDFPKRQVIPIVIKDLPVDAPELVLSELLQKYRTCREQRLKDAPKSTQNTAKLVITSLQKRLLSSIEAFARTLKVHRASIDKQAEKQRQFDRQDFPLLVQSIGADDDRADLSEEEIATEEDAQMTKASQQVGQDISAEELALLAEMASISQNARHQTDARVDKLVNWIRENMCADLGQPKAAWNGRRLLIFTEYLDTKRYLEQRLTEAISDASQRLGFFHGGMGEERRELIKAAFNSDPQTHPLRILIATDAAREGINLQNYCADLFHFDIPWNPSRMEQRNGRIDRKLQREKEVRCHYFVLAQRSEDRVLEC
jgi:SNF2 family DNA or RNA helicase